MFVKPGAQAQDLYSAAGTSHVLSGRASWYCNNDGSRAQISSCHYQYPDTGANNAYAAAGPELRAALGQLARPDGAGRRAPGQARRLVPVLRRPVGLEKLIDLYYDVYARIGSSVTIRW